MIRETQGKESKKKVKKKGYELNYGNNKSNTNE
jgi:hypothetical protein